MAFYLLSPAPGIWRMVHKEPAVAMGDTYLRGLMHESRWISKYSMKLIKIGYVMIINTIYIWPHILYIYIYYVYICTSYDCIFRMCNLFYVQTAYHADPRIRDDQDDMQKSQWFLENQQSHSNLYLVGGLEHEFYFSIYTCIYIYIGTNNI